MRTVRARTARFSAVPDSSGPKFNNKEKELEERSKAFSRNFLVLSTSALRFAYVRKVIRAVNLRQDHW
jgi:hypothetical protein